MKYVKESKEAVVDESFHIAYLGLVIYLFLSFFHPEEIFGFLRPLRLALLVSVATIILAYFKRSQTTLIENKKIYTLINCFFILNISSILFSDFSYGSTSFIIDVIKLLFLFYLIAWAVSSEKIFFKLIRIICIYIGIIAIVSLFAYRFGFHPHKQWRLTSYFGGMGSNSNGFAMVLGCLLPLLLSQMIIEIKRNQKNKKYLTTIIVMIIAILFCILRTRSRMGMISIFIITVATLWQYRKNIKVWIAVIALILIAFLNVSEKSWERLRTARTEARQNINEISKYSSARRNKWRQAIFVAKENPIFGAGLGKFRSAVRKYDLGEDQYVVHNSYLEIAAESGFINAGIFAMILILPIYRIYKISKKINAVDSEFGLTLKAFQLGNVVLVFALIFLSEAYSPIVYLQTAMANKATSIGINKIIKKKNS